MITFDAYTLTANEEVGATFAAAQFNAAQLANNPAWVAKTPKQYLGMRFKDVLQSWYRQKIKQDADAAAQTILDANP